MATKSKNNMMKIYFSILFLFISPNIIGQNNLSAIKGNWFDSNRNWILTINDNVIIYKNQIGIYEVESITNQQILLQSKSGLNVKQMSIFLIDSSNIKITCDTENQTQILYKHRNFKVPIQNNDINFEPEFVTINGFINNFKNYYEFNNLKFGFADWLTGNYKELFAEIDTSGFFSLTFLQYSPEEFSIGYGNKYIRLYMVPGDTITVLINADKFPEGFLVMSKHADMAYNVADFEKYSGKRVNKNSTIEQMKSQLMDAESYKIWRDSLKNADLLYASEYLINHKHSNHFQNWLTTKYKYQYICDLAENYTKERQLNNSGPFDEFYLSLLDSINTGSTNSELFSVVNRYNNLFYYLALAKPDIKGVIKHFSDHSQISLNTSEMKQDPEIKLISKTESVNVDEYIQVVSNNTDGLMRDALIANCFNRYKKYYNQDSLAYKIYSNIETDKAKAKFYEEYMQRKETKVNENSITYETNEGRELLNEIINKHKNKLLYLDFWGTFCGPCLTDFKYAANLKAKYKEKDVAFIYLCERGDEKRWNEIIEEYNVSGDHYLLNKRQYVGLAKIFNLTYVPRYILIDKEGRIIDSEAPRPSEELELRSLLDKNL